MSQESIDQPKEMKKRHFRWRRQTTNKEKMNLVSIGRGRGGFRSSHDGRGNQCRGRNDGQRHFNEQVT